MTGPWFDEQLFQQPCETINIFCAAMKQSGVIVERFCIYHSTITAVLFWINKNPIEQCLPE